MLSEIKIYSIKVMKKSKFLFFFKRKEVIEYILTYRIDEDRFWFYKIENGIKIDDHLMKQNLSNSVSTMEGIKERYLKFNEFLTSKCNIEIFSLSELNLKMYQVIDELSDKKEDLYIKKNKSYISGGFLLNNDISEI